MSPLPRLFLYCVVAGLAQMVVGSAADAELPSKPNVLFIAVDDLNHWVGYFGRNPQCKTPNIDRLSAQGMSFTNAHCVAPACEPSRAALLSGMRPTTTGCYHNGDKWKQHVPEGLGLTHALRENGYYAVGAGKIYHGASRYDSEWDEYFDFDPKQVVNVPKYEGYFQPLKKDLQDDEVRDWQTADYCIEQLGQQHDKPFFIACGIHKPHLPFAVPRKYYDAYPRDSIELPPYREDDLQDVPPAGVKMAGPERDHRKFRELDRWPDAIRSYLAAVAYADMNVGRVLDALEASPHRDNTIIVLWGDHGWHFGEKHHWRKFSLWEEATRAPLVWVVPGMTEPGSVCDRPVDFLTIYPTVCDLTDTQIPDHVEGKSLRPLLEGDQRTWEEVAVTTHGYENHAVRTDRWRYIRYADGGEELYDHTADPYEWKNLAMDPSYESIKSELTAHLPRDAKRPSKKSKPADD